MPVTSEESMKQKGYICLKIEKEAEESYLFKSVPQKLFKAKDVQDPNFKSGIPGWKRKAQKPHSRMFQQSFCECHVLRRVERQQRSNNKPGC